MESITITQQKTDNNTIGQLAKSVTDLDELLSDSPLNPDDAEALFEAIMADRRLRRELDSNKDNR